MNTARRGLGAAAALVLLMLSACGSDSKSSSATIPGAQPQTNPVGGDRSLSGGGEAPAGTVAGSGTGTGVGNLPTEVLTPDTRKLVITMTVGLEVADAAAAVNKVIALADAHGGSLYNSSLDLTNPVTAGGDLVFKLPPEEVEAFLTGLEPAIGRRTGLQGNTADVTRQLSDLDAQITTARKSLERVRALLDSAKDLDEVIKLEGEVSTRETHLEELLAQQADISGRVAQATITVHLTTAPVVAAEPVAKKDKGIGAAFAAGWRGFVAVLAAFALFVGYTAPFLVLLGIAGAVWWRIGRRAQLSRREESARRSRSAAPPPPPAPGADPRTSTLDSEDVARTR